MSEYVKIGKRGTIVIPAGLRRQYGLSEGDLIAMEQSPNGVLIKPVCAYESEVYTPERTAEFLLNNAVDAAEYDASIERVRAMGLDPDSIPHQRRPE